MYVPGTMLILRGITGIFPDPAIGGKVKYWRRGALDEPPALEYAKERGYVGKVLDVDGATSIDSEQVDLAVKEFRSDKNITALYGFSGGGYNIKHIIDILKPLERARIKLLVVLGAPRDPPSIFHGPWELVYQNDPPEGHMYGPRELLAKLEDSKTEGVYLR